ncbi:hypothetical protein E8L99_00405 [Phreatobacter aquaticus]|uniref:Phasin n=1 Tax=Phreatobacter aquaticus TaxID=2570229 RepID=A0A4D7QFZ3_9HYPH|nr:hypothetical protein [Phreatobacter aquaticus]QCK84366.1 hypothetical protein E8L99_00405 [Phreatobacter aquaticus]
MTEKTAKTKAAEAPKAETTAFAPVAQILETLKGAQEKLQVPTAARDFVKRNAETAKVRVADAETSVLNATATVEKALVAVVGAGASVSRGLIDATIANVTLTLGAVQSIADASSPKDAGERYVAYLRELGQTNLTRAQDAFNTVRQVATDGAKSLQAEVGKFGSFGKAA